jgi:hypothetical protein
MEDEYEPIGWVVRPTARGSRDVMYFDTTSWPGSNWPASWGKVSVEKVYRKANPTKEEITILG